MKHDRSDCKYFEKRKSDMYLIKFHVWKWHKSDSFLSFTLP